MSATESRAVAIAALLLATGCAGTTAPRGFLPEPREAQTDAFGSWIDLVYGSDEGRAPLQGELIAITSDSTWVLDQAGLSAIPTPSLIEGQLTEYDSRTGTVAGGAVLGFVSTISNGVFLLFTGPMWIIGGTTAAAVQSRLPNRLLTEETPASLSRFARFPGGMPQGLDVGDLVPKGR